jgi:putative transposase
MTDTEIVPRKSGRQPSAKPALVDQELADQLLARAQAEGAELLGPDGLLSQVTKAVLERALAEEMTEHWVMRSTTRPVAGRVTAVTARRARRC